MKIKIVCLVLIHLLMISFAFAETAKEYPFSVEQAKQITKAEWKEKLTKQEYQVLWEAGTERSFTGDLLHNKKEGVYVSAGCGVPVFHSSAKFESGTGWPSFWEPISEENIILKEDRALFSQVRVEVLSKCGEHLGHVFPDGPEPTGLRYCINSAALDFVEAKSK